MTGMDDERATRRSKRLERSRPEPAAPPASRARRAEGQVPPREREASVPAAPPPASRVEGSVPPGEREALVPAARAARPPSPPLPKREGPVRSAWPGTAYVPRNRLVPDTSDREPYVPARCEKRKEPKDDRPCSSGKKPKQPQPWEASSCARAGLEHYNSANKGDEHELVKAVGVHSFIWCGGWLHANFLARCKDANNCVDLVPKYFFAELKLDGFGLSCASCFKIDSVESKNLGGCRLCPEKIMHPAAGGVYIGAQPRRVGPADSGLEISFSF